MSIEKKISYTFTNKGLLKQALTHRSAHPNHNERLEFLGDAMLNAIITEAIFQQLQHTPEGQLTRLRASLVKGETLAELGLELKLGDALTLGQGEMKSGGFRRASILADAFEAIIGAVFLDGGFEACRSVVLFLYQNRLQEALTHCHTKDPKTELQEFLQARKLCLPTYELISIKEHGQESTFHIVCSVASIAQKGSGKGTSRRKAEQEAASSLLKLLKNQ